MKLKRLYLGLCGAVGLVGVVVERCGVAAVVVGCHVGWPFADQEPDDEDADADVDPVRRAHDCTPPTRAAEAT